MRSLLKPIAFVGLCLIWGSTWLVIKVGYGGLGPFNVASVRFLVASLVFFALVPLFRARLPRGRAEWGLVMFVGTTLFAIDYGLIYWGEQWLGSGLTAVLFAVMPILTALAAHVYIPTERLTTRKLVGTLVAFGGVVVLFGDSLRIDPALALPMLAIVASAAGGAVGSVATKRHGHDLHPAALNAPAMMAGALLLAAASFVAGDGYRLPGDASTWGAVLYLALIGSVVTFLAYFWLLKTWEATTMSFIAVVTPVVALLLGYLALDERPSAWAGAGAALVVLGVLVASRARPSARPSRA